MKRVLVIAFSLLALGASRPLHLTLSPPRPTVGDLVTITFPPDVIRVVVPPSADFELVRSAGNEIVVRSFRPGAFSIEGQLLRDTERVTAFRNLQIVVASVLQPNDSLEPASLKPPRPLPPNATARAAIAAAAVAAAVSWLAVVLLSRRKPLVVVPQRVVSPSEEFRIALERAARVADGDGKAIALAEALRTYLARIGSYRRELTTFELLGALPRGDASSVICELLTDADLAKFSPWGAGSRDYRALVERLSTIPNEFEPVQEAA